MMQQLKLIVSTFFLFLCFSCFSQTLKDSNGDVLAIIDSTGKIVDLNNHCIGQFTVNGVVLDCDSILIGSIEENSFKNSNTIVIGSINQEDEIIDINNDKIGQLTVDTNLIIKDVNNHIIGQTESTANKKWVIAYYYFFFNQY
jgi:5-fold beta-flower domain-containing protein